MRKPGFGTSLLLSTLLSGTAVFRPAAAAQSAVAQPPDAAAVDAFWSRLDATWNSGDAGRFSKLFAENGSFHFVDRAHMLDGRAAILAHFTALFPNVAPEISHQTTVHKVRTIAPELRAVDATVEILRAPADEGAAPSVLRSFAVFGVMQQDGEGWRIRALSAYELPATAAGARDGKPAP